MNEATRKSNTGLLGLVGALAAVALLSFGMLAGSLFTRPAAAQSESPADRAIVVGGVGEVRVKPDMATIYFQIHVLGQTADEALAAYEKSATALTARLKELGLAAADVVVQPASTWPVAPVAPTDVAAAGYYADGSIEVSVRDLDKVRDIAMEGLKSEAGIGLSSIQYGLQDDGAARNEAMNKAIDNARSQADAVAAKLGLTVGTVNNVNVAPNVPSPIYYDRMATEVAAPDGLGGANFANLGTRPDIVVTMNVQVSYNIQ